VSLKYVSKNIYLYHLKEWKIIIIYQQLKTAWNKQINYELLNGMWRGLKFYEDNFEDFLFGG